MKKKPKPRWSEICLGLCLLPFRLPACLVETCWPNRRRKFLRNKHENPPRVSKRARRLSLDNDEREVGVEKHIARSMGKKYGDGICNGQETASFFRLPREIRDMIYRFCAEETVWVISNGEQGQLRAYREQGMIKGKEVSNKVTYICPKEFGMVLLPLLKTCRRTYMEAIDYLYKTPKFVFTNAYDFFAFSASLLPQRLQVVRSVHLVITGVQTRVDPPPKLPLEPWYNCFVPGHHMWFWHLSELSNHSRLDYTFLHKAQYPRRLYNACLITAIEAQKGDISSSYPKLWKTVCMLLGQMEGLRDCRIVHVMRSPDGPISVAKYVCELVKNLIARDREIQIRVELEDGCEVEEEGRRYLEECGEMVVLHENRGDEWESELLPLSEPPPDWLDAVLSVTSETD